jgi:hypothetical protein
MMNRSTWYRKLAFSAMVIPALLCSACGKANGRKPVFPVEGRILYEGRPLAHAFLVFHPVNDAGPQLTRPTATAENDGTFAPTTYEAADGAPAGEYAVTVEWYRPPTRDDVAPGPNQLPALYSKPASTPFKIRIVEGTNRLEPFQIKR